MVFLSDIILKNPGANQWFKLLDDLKKRAISPIIDHVILMVDSYNSYFNGFQLYLTGSSLNLNDRKFNDIDLMVVIPESVIKSYKQDLLRVIWNDFKDQNAESITDLLIDRRIQLLGMTDIIEQIIQFVNYSIAIQNKDRELLLTQLSSINEVNNILLEPEPELEGIKMRVEGLIVEEKNILTAEPDGTSGYQYGPLVEGFLKDTVIKLSEPAHDGKPWCDIYWYKSFSEGYGKTAGENNCHIQPRGQCVPVHLFLTTGVDYRKAMEKKESFMIEYYTDEERLKPIQLY